MKKILSLIFALLCTSAAFADAGVNLLLTKGSDKAIPIAVVPFVEPANASATQIADVIASDLRFTGQFKVSDKNNLPAHPHQLSEVHKADWRPSGVEDVVIGSVSSQGADQISVNFSLVDLVKDATPQALLQQSYHVPNSQKRALAHHIADLIYEKLTGVKGFFSTRIAYIQQSNTTPSTYSLFVADADGFNPRSILASPEPIMSPAWSPDGKKLAYVSFEGKKAQIYITTLANGARSKVSDAPGINGAPAWSPDGKKLALVLSKTGHPKIYLLDLASGQLTQLTNGVSIDTEPSFAPDGQSFIFTSDRGGSPQIYRYYLTSGKIERLTYAGDYNARASFSRDAKQIVMINRTNGQYNIAVQNLQSGTPFILTHSGRDDSPSFAPNGMMVLYGNESGELGLVSTDGRVKLRVPGRGAKVQDPAWSPFL